MTRHKPDAIERLAQEVLRKAGVLSIPTDLSKVADSLGVQVHDEEMEADVSGVLIVKGHERHVLVNSTHAENRRRFTIAHELGHLVLHDNVDQDDADAKRIYIDRQIRVYQRVAEASSDVYKQEGSLTDAAQEREANTFAACLLMPSHHVIRAAQERDLFDEVSVASMARTFGVSEQAMSIRLQQLKLVSPDFGPEDASPSLGAQS